MNESSIVSSRPEILVVEDRPTKVEALQHALERRVPGMLDLLADGDQQRQHPKKETPHAQ